MKIISFIEDLDIIVKILSHVNLWDIRNHDPPVTGPVVHQLLAYLTLELRGWALNIPCLEAYNFLLG